MAEKVRSSNTTETLSRLYHLIALYNKKNISLTADTMFSKDLELDSLTVMDLVAAIEDEFDIVLPLNLLPELQTIQQVAEAVMKIRQKQ